MSSVSERPLGTSAFRVVIVGGGVGAIEAALALREYAQERVALTIATEATEFVYRPFAVVRPFRSRPTYRIELAQIAADLDAERTLSDADAVEADGRQVTLSNGRRLSYDALLIAIGAQAEAVVGAGTLTPWDWGEGHAFRSILNALDKGEARSVGFIVPPGMTWPLPLYELALLTSAHLRDEGISGVSLSVITSERAPLEDFGAEASASVAALLGERGIALHTRSELAGIEGGTVRTSAGASIPADVTVAVPVIRPRMLEGVPTDAAGFIRTDEYCRIGGAPSMFAAGDCTNQPIKQGGLASQQADTAAAGIAALAGAAITPDPYRPRLQAVLLTGDAPLQLDQSGAKPIPPDTDATFHPQPAEKIVARYLTPYLTQAAPALPLETPS